jgi:hypothetical protein
MLIYAPRRAADGQAILCQMTSRFLECVGGGVFQRKLASNEFPFMTEAQLVIDGGKTAQAG